MRRAEQAAAVIGFGMGGFLDFMLLHLILQWHHMISNRLPPSTLEALQRNIFWDGMGQAGMWVIVFLGIMLLLSAAQQRHIMPGTLRFLGLFIVGWGVFNFLDGTLNHYVFEFHNVREDVARKQLWNMGWLVVAGLIFPAVGALIARAGRRTAG